VTISHTFIDVKKKLYMHQVLSIVDCGKLRNAKNLVREIEYSVAHK
jgi:hypothetical protein